MTYETAQKETLRRKGCQSGTHITQCIRDTERVLSSDERRPAVGGNPKVKDQDRKAARHAIFVAEVVPTNTTEREKRGTKEEFVEIIWSGRGGMYQEVDKLRREDSFSN